MILEHQKLLSPTTRSAYYLRKFTTENEARDDLMLFSMIPRRYHLGNLAFSMGEKKR